MLTQDLADHVPRLELLVEGGVPPCVLDVYIQLDQAAHLQRHAQLSVRHLDAAAAAQQHS